MWQKPSEACPLYSEPQPECNVQHWQMSAARRSDSILFLSLQLLVSLSGSSLVTLNGEIPCLLMHTTGKLSPSDPGPGVWFALDSMTQRVSASLEKGSAEIDKLVRKVHLKKIVSFRARQHAGAGGRHRERSEMPFSADLGKGMGGQQHLERSYWGCRACYCHHTKN